VHTDGSYSKHFFDHSVHVVVAPSHGRIAGRVD